MGYFDTPLHQVKGVEVYSQPAFWIFNQKWVIGRTHASWRRWGALEGCESRGSKTKEEVVKKKHLKKREEKSPTYLL